MFVESYYSRSGNFFSFSKQQASDFAKQLADDFNPLHDPDHRRFCVPGDLLFSLVLSQFGANQAMRFDFLETVNETHSVQFVIEETGELFIEGDDQKRFVRVVRQGDTFAAPASVEDLTRQYVAFSGQTFPHVLVGLMKKENVSVNPVRPMVMYQSMSLNFTDFYRPNLTLKLDDATLDVEERRGKVRLFFSLLAGGKMIGTGEKAMLMSGLREYNKSEVEQLVSLYNKRKRNYSA